MNSARSHNSFHTNMILGTVSPSRRDQSAYPGLLTLAGKKTSNKTRDMLVNIVIKRGGHLTRQKNHAAKTVNTLVLATVEIVTQEYWRCGTPILQLAIPNTTLAQVGVRNARYGIQFQCTSPGVNCHVGPSEKQ